jgi:hypothetical protein
MRAEHYALDGSTVAFDLDADLGSGVTATGWAIAPAISRAHPFRTSPPGYTAIVEKVARSRAVPANIESLEEFSVHGGALRVAHVEMPVSTGGTRKLTVGGWEGRGGCLSTSLAGWVRDRLVEVFDTLRFTDRDRGITVESPVVSQPREPLVVKEVSGLGLLSVRPAISSVLQRVPRATGARTPRGELFRLNAERRDLLYVSGSAVVAISPMPGLPSDRMMALAQSLGVEWTPARQP